MKILKHLGFILIILLISCENNNSVDNTKGAINSIKRYKETDSLFFVAVDYYNKKKYDSSIMIYSKIINIDSSYMEAYINRGSSYLHKEQYNLAIQDINHVIERKPDEKICYNLRMQINKSQRKYKLALDDINIYLELVRTLNVDSVTLGYIFASKSECELNLKKIDLALESANIAINYQPKYSFAYYQRALAYFELGEKELACEDIQRVVDSGIKGVPIEALERCK